MTTDELDIIDKEIEKLIKDKTDYNFSTLKQKVEVILKDVNIFKIENELDTKAVDLYFKNVIIQRNEIQKQKEKN